MEREIQKLSNLLMEYEPEAKADIQGSREFSSLSGTALFYPFWSGTLIFLFATGLPSSNQPCDAKLCAFHIHEGSWCSGTAADPFANAGTHFNPLNCPHPEHAGDLPLLLSNHGTAFQMVYTDRFTPQDVIGRTAIVHLNADDYHTQPSGNAGTMIGCGEIKPFYECVPPEA